MKSKYCYVLVTPTQGKIIMSSQQSDIENKMRRGEGRWTGMLAVFS